MRFGRVEYLREPRWAEFLSENLVRLWPRGFDFDGSAGSGDFAGLPSLAGTEECPLEEVSLLTPLPAPGKIICVGKNYADHALEMGGEVPELPVIFSKFASALIPSGAAIELPSISHQVDFEAELVVVIGKPGRNIPRSSAFQHVLGYTCGNDVSARDWQKGRPGGQWLLGKTFDTFAPLGPWISTPDETGDPGKLDISLKLNGQTMQSANTQLLIYPVDFLIEHLSRFFTLRTGDLIFTGTPAGVGAGRTPPLWLKAGDLCEVEISRIGKLSNPVVAPESV